MSSIIYDNFKSGLDRRNPQAMGPANALYVLNNAYITTGFRIKKRPCARLYTTLTAGTVGLKAAGGVLNTFYESGSIGHSDPLFAAVKVGHPTLSQAVDYIHYGEMFDGYLYCVIEYADGSVWHHYVDGTVPQHVTDANCPQSYPVRKSGAKLYAPNDANVRFCAAAAPRDWTTANDAGFISAGSNAAGSDTVRAVSGYQEKLAIFFDDSMQLWVTDPDPANNVMQANATIGTKFPESTIAVAGDLAFLSAQGIRTITQTALTNNLQENDLGSPIDALRTEIADGDRVIAVTYPKLGQLWMIDGDTVYVYSYSRSAKLAAWSKYTFPFTVDAAAVLSNELYLRSGDDVYIMDAAVFSDDGDIPLVEIEMFHQDAKTSGVLKQFIGCDGVSAGSPSLAFKFNTNDGTDITDYVQLDDDMRPGDMTPVEVAATSIAPCLTHQLDEAFELTAIQLYYFELGPV